MDPSIAKFKVLLCLLLLLAPICQSDAAAAAAAATSIPRSQTSDAVRQRYLTQYHPHRQQPGDHQEKINGQGFVTTVLNRKSGRDDPRSSRRQLERHPLCRIRQVPGDGSCLFHSLSLCLRHAVNGTHWNMDCDINELFTFSNSLRQMAVDCLLEGQQRKLFVQGNEWLPAQELADIAAQQYGLTGAEYCAAMRDETTWGGGPEIVALSNVLRRPIHVYELCVVNNNKSHNNKGTATATAFGLRRMACFGSPRYDHASALHVLSADSRFPDLAPGKQNVVGNHFLAVFPVRRTKKLDRRGGETTSTTTTSIDEWDGSDQVDMEDEFDTAPPSIVERLTSHLYGWLDYLVDFLDFEEEDVDPNEESSGEN
jgi:OTU-like cysteine protease